MTRYSVITGLLLCSFAVGCGTSQSWTGLTSRFSRRNAETDALVLNDEALSEGFQKSRGGLTKKGLKDPEGTNLAFARWKEDMDQFAEAKRRYHEILTANPDCLPARMGIARIERETGRYTQCREILEAAREQHPNDPSVALEMGRMYNDRKEWDAAVRAFSEASDLAPDDQTVRYELGLALVNSGRIGPGLAHLKYAVGDSAACYNVAYLLNERGKTEEAVNWVERALQSHPDERTRQMAGELLAKMRVPEPGFRSHGVPQSAIASRQSRDMAPPQIIAASPASHPSVEPNSAGVARMSDGNGQPAVRSAAPSANPYRMASSQTTAAAAPPQWSGPGGQQQPRVAQQSQWSRSTRSTVPVHAAGFTQPLPQPTDPPAWRQ